ncbi:MAG: histidine phosphatase family protein [Clostridiales bacterium]|nr:histidine phosphatase family protein [Clostridiales bacterium]
MKNTQYKVVLIRHAESDKNIKKIHGGKGEKLTERGVQQTIELSQQLNQCLDCNNLNLITSSSFHTNATAAILAQQLGITVGKPIIFRPLNLGVADGLSEQELTQRYPEVQRLFEKWRAREIDIKQLKVPQMEPYLDFWQRGLDIIANLPKDRDSLLVCSNSLMILLANIMLGNHPVNTDRYKHITIRNCGLIAFDTQDFCSFTLNEQLTTVDIDH